MNTSSRPKDRRERGTVTKEVILDVAMQLFAQHGYDSTTTRMIAHQAGVAEGTLYIYFPSKRHILLALLEQVGLPALKDIFAGWQEASDAEVLKSFFSDRIHFGQQYADLLRALLPQAMYDRQVAEQLLQEFLHPAATIVKDYIARRIQDGAFREMDIDSVARVLVGAFWFTILFDHLLACPDAMKEQVLKRHTPEVYAEVFTNLLLEGLQR